MARNMEIYRDKAKLRKKTIQDWVKGLKQITDEKLRCAVCSIIWWDFVSDMTAKEPWIRPAFEAFLHKFQADIIAAVPLEQQRAELIRIGYTAKMAKARTKKLRLGRENFYEESVPSRAESYCRGAYGMREAV